MYTGSMALHRIMLVAAFDVVVADAMTMMQPTGQCSMKSMPSSMSTLTHDVYILSKSC